MSTVIGECSICFSHLDCADDNICVLHCGHVFHSLCINQWIANRPTCPECRLPVTQEQPVVRHLYLNLPKDTRSEQMIAYLLTQINEQNNENEKLSASVTNLQESLEEKNESETNTTELIDHLNIELKKNNDLRKENYLFQSQLDEKRSANEQLSISVTILQNEIQQTINQKNVSEANAAKALYELDLDQKKNNHLREEIYLLRSQLKEKNTDLLQTQLNDHKSTNEKLSSSVTNLQEELQKYIHEKNKSEASAAKAIHQLDHNKQKNGHLREEIYLLQSQLKEENNTNEKLSESVTNLQEELHESVGEKNESEAKAARVLHEFDLEQKNHETTAEALWNVKMKTNELETQLYEQGQAINLLHDGIDLLDAEKGKLKNANWRLKLSVGILQRLLQISIDERNDSEANTVKAVNQLKIEQKDHKNTKETLCDIDKKNKNLRRRLNETTNNLRKGLDLLESQVND